MAKVHFIGIGGIGTSSLAQYHLATGWQVSGSDAVKSEITDDLKKRGVRILISPKNINLKNVSLVIHSVAIKLDHPELLEAKKLGIKTQLYSEAVGELTKKYFTIAVSGSHGKSTTTALIGLILKEAGLDPTIIVGTKLKELDGTNFLLGKSEYLVLEADEYVRSFHNYFPKIAVLTNIDKEHLDIYKNLNGVLAGFKKYLNNVEVDGWVVANKEDNNIKKVLDYKFRFPTSSIVWYGKGKHKLVIPGIHNQFNAEAAWQAVKLLGVKKTVADKVFHTYQGAWRRLEKLDVKKSSPTSPRLRGASKLRDSSCEIYSDYAHHPTEIKATLQALKEKYPKKKLVCVFQPHQQDRLNRLFKDFVTAFDVADKTILYPLYKVKGRDTVGRTSADLVRAIKKDNVFYAEDFKNVLNFLSADFDSDSVIVFMSAGDLDTLARKYFLK
ncbi:MAG: Mur ligase domain-containing protein [bacterium]|nr:Mur ligase domain-containing protein [bacterium]